MSVAKKMLMASSGADVAWDISYAYWYPVPGIAGVMADLTNAEQFGSDNIAAQQSQPYGVFYKPDGTKAYISGNADNEIDEYNLSVPWSVSTAVAYQSAATSASNQAPAALFFKPDGTKMYVGDHSDKKVYEYSVSTAWDITTISETTSFDVSGQMTGGSSVGLWFKDDGTKMYICDTGTDNAHEYSLSTAWDISSASFDHSLDVGTNSDQPTDIAFSGDGLTLFVLSNSAPDSIGEWTLSTAWDISTGSFTGKYANLDSFFSASQGLYVSADKGYIYVMATSNDTIYQWVSGGFYPSSQISNFYGITFKPDGTRLYIVGYENSAPYQNHVFEYSLSTAFDLSSATFVHEFNVQSQSTVSQGLFFKSDGTSMYVIDGGSDAVYQYTLSTAWLVSSASYASKSLSVSAQDANPAGLFFKPDGTKMYHTGGSSDEVHEYDLSTAWDVSTGSFLQSFSVSAQEFYPVDVFFKPDGTKMYVGGLFTAAISEYTLSTAWDISTASFAQSNVAKIPTNGPQGSYFSDDGTIMFRGNDTAVFRFNIGVQE